MVVPPCAESEWRYDSSAFRLRNAVGGLCCRKPIPKNAAPVLGRLVLIVGVKRFGGIVSVRLHLVIEGTERVARDAGEEIGVWNCWVVNRRTVAKNPVSGVGVDEAVEHVVYDLSVMSFCSAHMTCNDRFQGEALWMLISCGVFAPGPFEQFDGGFEAFGEDGVLRGRPIRVVPPDRFCTTHRRCGSQSGNSRRTGVPGVAKYPCPLCW